MDIFASNANGTLTYSYFHLFFIGRIDIAQLASQSAFLTLETKFDEINGFGIIPVQADNTDDNLIAYETDKRFRFQNPEGRLT
jgi:hypothetical protein